MKLHITERYHEMSELASTLLIQEIKGKQSFNLGMATGSTDLGLYRCLHEAHQQEEIDFKQVHMFNLDEYYPISPDDPQSSVST